MDGANAGNAGAITCHYGRSPIVRLSIARNAGSYVRSYSNGSTSENPIHMMIVRGIPTRRKSENL
jgi:hypothetical protein